jgi:hypothetical protein
MTAFNPPITPDYLDGLETLAAAQIQAETGQEPRRVPFLRRYWYILIVFFALGNWRAARAALAEHDRAIALAKEERRVVGLLRPEAILFGKLLEHRLAMLGHSHLEVVEHKKRFTSRVRFDRYVMMSENEFVYRVLTARAGFFGTKSMLPYRSNVAKLLEEEVQTDLAITVNRQIVVEHHPGRGLFVRIFRNADQADIPHLVRFSDVIGELTPDKPEIILGVSSRRQVRIARLDKVPHAMIAGSTGSGKSVMLNSLICCLIRNNTPRQIKMILIDLKRVEFWDYYATPPAPIPHLAAPVIDSATEANRMLKRILALIKVRYGVLKGTARNIDEYNRTHAETMPRLVVIIDEMAEIMLDTDNKRAEQAEKLLIRIAQLGRAAGVHLICCTQRPSKEVVTTNLTAQLDLRFSGRMAQQWDSTTVLGTGDAALLENIPGRSCYRIGPDVVKVQPPLIERPAILESVGIAQAMPPYELELPDLEAAESMLEEESAAFPNMEAALTRMWTMAGGRLDIQLVMEVLGLTQGQAALFQQRAIGTVFWTGGEQYHVISVGKSYRVVAMSHDTAPAAPSENGKGDPPRKGLRYRKVPSAN